MSPDLYHPVNADGPVTDSTIGLGMPNLRDPDKVRELIDGDPISKHHIRVLQSDADPGLKQDSLSALVGQLDSEVKGYAMSITRSESDAEEIAQEVWAKLWVNPSNI